jgi:hypothetical protein
MMGSSLDMVTPIIESVLLTTWPRNKEVQKIKRSAVGGRYPI